MMKKLLSLNPPTFSPAGSGPTPAGSSGAPTPVPSPLDRLQGIGGKNGIGLADKPLPEIIGGVVSAFLGLLGVIFLVLMIYAGYTWMTAAGEEAKIEKAKDTIKNCIIGLVLVLTAYGVTRLIVSLLGQATGA